ncbi:MAG: hypothetical protein MMC33_009460 [Icmadophila ericetorum]|nr:hypothetical protein [Icmadophila ericetorum]
MNWREACRVICRILGLNVIIAFSRYLGSLRKQLSVRHEEAIKIAIRQSRGTALLRTLIHVVPVGIALWEVILNWNTYYVGSFALNQVYYQFGAKVHEMMMQASLAAIVFSYIRYEMALGDGLPFGALFSGIQISQVSYLWSMEFWGSILSESLPIRRKLALLAVVTFSFVLATAVGPSSAILLVPRLDFWPAGSTHIWINATFDELWPTV